MKKLAFLIKQADKCTRLIFEKEISIRDTEWSYIDASLIGLLENLNNMASSIIVLQNASSFAGIESLLRITFENYIFLKYILEKDSLNRATAYSLSDIKFQKRYFDLLIDPGRKGKDIRNLLSTSIEEVQESSRSFSNPEFIAKLDKRYTDCFSGHAPKVWYNYDNKTANFEQLCNKMGETTMYNILYRVFSRETHSAKANDLFSYTPDSVAVKSPTISKELTESAVGLFLVESIRGIYNHYNLRSQLTQFNITIKYNYTHDSF